MLVRHARPADLPRFLELVRELADFEKMEGPSPEAAARLREDAFGAKPRFELFLGEVEDRVDAYAVVFEAYSTFRAAPILYLEDLYVSPSARRKGLAGRMMQVLAAEALRRKCCRMSWVVLDWNRDAQRFYESVGARRQAEWWPYTLEGDDLARVASPDTGTGMDDRDAS